MLHKIKKIVKQYKSLRVVGIYTASNFLTKTISFASMPLFTYMLSKKDFGIISIFSSSVSFLMPFISLGVLYSTSTDYFQMDKRKFSSFIISTFSLPIFATLLSVIVLFLAFPFLQNYFSFSPLFIWLIPVLAYCNFLYDQNLTLVRNDNNHQKYLWLTVSKVILELGIALLLIAVLYWGWKGRIWAFLAGGLIYGGYSIYYLYKNEYLSGVISFSIIKKELVYSLPVIATQFSIFCLNTSDRYFINYYYGEERTGVYSLAATFASIILILSTALLQYLLPRIYAELKNNTSSAEIRRLFKKYCLMMFAGIVVIIILSTIAYHTVIHPKFLEGLNYFYMLIIGNTIWSIAYFFYSFLIYYKAKKKFLIVAASSVITSLLFNYFFIKVYGEMGAAISSVCIYLVIWALIFLVTKKYFYKVFNQ